MRTLAHWQGDPPTPRGSCSPGGRGQGGTPVGWGLAAWPRPQHPVSQPPGGPPAAGCRGERVVAGGAGRELAGHAHPRPQALQHAAGPHQPALGVSPRPRTRLGGFPRLHLRVGSSRARALERLPGLPGAAGWGGLTSPSFRSDPPVQPAAQTCRLRPIRGRDSGPAPSYHHPLLGVPLLHSSHPRPEILTQKEQTLAISVPHLSTAETQLCP